MARATATGGGVTVARVFDEAFGLEVGDVLSQLDAPRVGATVLHDVSSLVRVMHELRAGDEVTLHVRREARTLRVRLPLPALPTERDDIVLGHVVTPSGDWLRTLETPARDAHAPVVFYLQSSDWSSCEHPKRAQHPVRRLIEAMMDRGLGTFRVERSGTGDSEGPPCTEVDFHDELAAYDAALAELMARGERVVLFGNSLGGMVAPLLAEHRGVSAIVVLGTTANTWHDALLAAYERQRGRQEDDRDARLLADLQHEVFVQGRTPAEVYTQRPELRDAGFDHFAGRYAHGRDVAFFQQLQRAGVADAWKSVSAPTLVLHGADDWICTAEDARDIAQLAGANARNQELSGVDHGLASEGAVDRVASAVAAFLGDVDQTSTVSSGSAQTQP